MIQLSYFFKFVTVIHVKVVVKSMMYPITHYIQKQVLFFLPEIMIPHNFRVGAWEQDTLIRKTKRNLNKRINKNNIFMMVKVKIKTRTILTVVKDSSFTGDIQQNGA